MKTFVVEVKVSFSVEVTADEIRRHGYRVSPSNARLVASGRVNDSKSVFETTTKVIDTYDQPDI